MNISTPIILLTKVWLFCHKGVAGNVPAVKATHAAMHYGGNVNNNALTSGFIQELFYGE